MPMAAAPKQKDCPQVRGSIGSFSVACMRRSIVGVTVGLVSAAVGAIICTVDVACGVMTDEGRGVTVTPIRVGDSDGVSVGAACELAMSNCRTKNSS